ncbi:flagellar cap protein FliD [Clostridium intestinale URNW]|uniref:Flagellar hook-associated protein 2 n=1 Tax=Clostridium intestinale URNW TaxID=1294142 RepID=U2NR44_9CLOT|nr:flagellar cap protein FliD [Clostridium intestinale URNW]
MTGLATGMDTDAMVKQAMQAYQLKVDQAKQARDLQVFKQTLYRDAIKDLRGIFTKYTDISKPDSLLLTKNYGTSKFTSTNEGEVTAEGLPNAVLGNYKVEVQKVATTAKLELDNFDNIKGQKITINISGKAVDVDLTDIEDGNNISNSDMIKRLNNAMKAAGVAGKFSTSDISGKIILQSTNTGSDQKIEISKFTNKEIAYTIAKYEDIKGENLEFTVDGNIISVDLSTIPSEVTDVERKLVTLEKINQAIKGSGVEARYEEVALKNEDGSLKKDESGKVITETRIITTSKEAVEGNSITLKIGDGTKTAIESKVGKNDTVSIVKGMDGTNALVKITDTYGNTTLDQNGVAGFNTYQSNEITIDGVKFKINDITSSPVTISGTTDTSKLADKLKEFVKDYNEAIGKITTKLNEKKDFNYKPLTQEQKSDMTEDQIKKWEDKVKQGLLKRDNDLTGITSQLRSAFYDSIKGTNLNIKSLGIDFSNDVEKAGQLVIDEDKLSKALAENSEDVVKLFTQSAPSGTTDKKEIYNNSGIFQRIRTILNDSVMTSASPFLKKVGYEGTSTYSNNDITNDLLKREKQISYMESSLADRETRLYQKYASLETIMNKYNSQSAWLTQQFSS